VLNPTLKATINVSTLVQVQTGSTGKVHVLLIAMMSSFKIILKENKFVSSLVTSIQNITILTLLALRYAYRPMESEMELEEPSIVMNPAQIHFIIFMRMALVMKIVSLPTKAQFYQA